MTNEEASLAAYRLQAFRQLVANPAYIEELLPKLVKAEQEHDDGCTARNRTPEQRAEHVEAVHLARELKGFCAKRIADLEASLKRYAQTESA